MKFKPIDGISVRRNIQDTLQELMGFQDFDKSREWARTIYGGLLMRGYEVVEVEKE